MTSAPKLSNRLELRVYRVALFGLIAVAAVTAGLALSSGGARGAASVLGAFVYFALIWVGPAGGPAAMLGAFLAIRAMNREPLGQPLWRWAWRGVSVGGPLGAANTAGWFVVMFASVPEHLLRVIGPVTATGAAAGAGVGLLTACYCWRVRR